ncbi:MAG: DUF3108 domain-containing protein [Bradymonadaceae bacterium]|nr:DUF3108 domain-containing protein [Lujinxingiaceae bacterium]
MNLYARTCHALVGRSLVCLLGLLVAPLLASAESKTSESSSSKPTPAGAEVNHDQDTYDEDIDPEEANAALASEAPSSPDTTAARQPVSFRWPGEEFYYSVRINGAEAMRAGIRVGQVRYHNERPYVPISGTAQSTGFFHSIYPLDDRANTFFDPSTYRPWRSEKFFDEKGQQRTYNVDYLHDKFVARIERIRDDGSMRFSAPIPDTTHDMLTWMYEMRDHEKLEIGQKLSVYLYDGWLLSRLDLIVVAREDVYTPMGWFKAWKIDFSREVLRSRAGQRKRGDKAPVEPILELRQAAKHTGSLWLSRDENHLPIKVSINTLLGIGEAVLIKYKPANSKP